MKKSVTAFLLCLLMTTTVFATAQTGQEVKAFLKKVSFLNSDDEFVDKEILEFNGKTYIALEDYAKDVDLMYMRENENLYIFENDIEKENLKLSKVGRSIFLTTQLIDDEIKSYNPEYNIGEFYNRLNSYIPTNECNLENEANKEMNKAINLLYESNNYLLKMMIVAKYDTIRKQYSKKKSDVLAEILDGYKTNTNCNEEEVAKFRGEYLNEYSEDKEYFSKTSLNKRYESFDKAYKVLSEIEITTTP